MTTDNTNTTRNDSLAARTDTWLQSFLVWSPGQRDIIKTVALVLMVLDHINLIFQLKQEWMFLAGRGAFPLFALVWGLNLSRHAHIRQPAINRLWGWGIIAQFAYYLAGFPWYEGNTGRGYRPAEREYPATITPVVAVIQDGVSVAC